MTLRPYATISALLLAIILAPLATAGEGTFDRDGSYKTANFRTTAPNRDLAAKFGDMAEQYRREKAMEWLGREMPQWPDRCPLRVEINLKQSGGATTFGFGTDDRGRSGVSSQEMKIWGEANQLLNSVLPHEVTHTVLAFHFGKPVPRWADEGGSVLSENEDECYQHDIRCREILNQGRGVQLGYLFRMTEYPRDMIVVYAQGYSISQFLINRGGRAKFLEFVGYGMRNRNTNWEAAVREVYGFQSTDDLQETWIESLKTAPQRTSARAKSDATTASRNRSEIRGRGLSGTPLLAEPVVARGQAGNDREREAEASPVVRVSRPTPT
ncbi:MAG: hypothetical protein ACRCZF_19605, partial [Gemmataceae bacterium]